MKKYYNVFFLNKDFSIVKVLLHCAAVCLHSTLCIPPSIPFLKEQK